MTQADLSLYHKILVFVEDKGKATISELTDLGNLRQTLGALGRLEGLGYITRKIEDDGSRTFLLTDEGDTLLATLLDFIQQSNDTWDGKWRVILFDVPESKRTVRQMLRIKLMDLGARMLQSSVWISPSQETIEKFKSIVATTEFGNTVHFFEATSLNPKTINIHKLWQLDALEKEYQKLFAYFESKVSKLAKSKNASFEAKCLLIQLALVMKKDPHLSADLMPKQWIGKKAGEWYKKIRPHCV